MSFIKKRTAKIVFSLLTLIAFMLILSPVYVYRSVVLKLTCAVPVRTDVTVSGMRYASDAFAKNTFHSETFTLEPSKQQKTFYLELPTENRFGGFLLYFPKAVRPIKITELAIINGRKHYPVSLNKAIVNYQNRPNVIASKDQLLIKTSRNMNIRFVRKVYMRVNRRMDPVMALYVFLISLLPALLVFFKVEIPLSRKTILPLLYSVTAVLFLIHPCLLIDYYSLLSDENRFLNKFPDFFVHRRFNTDFPHQFEKWFSDRFCGRRHAIAKEKKIFSPEFLTTKIRQSGTGFIGKENWMFEKLWNCVEMFQNKNRFTQAQLEVCANNLTMLDHYLKKNNIKLYVMLTPDKERVYPEYYPDCYKQVHPESRLEQLYQYLLKHTKVRVIFPLYELRKAKKQYPVFFKTGTHWNYRGALVAFNMLQSELKKDFPNIPADQPNTVSWRRTKSADTDIATFIGYSEPMKQLPEEMLMQDEPVLQCKYQKRDLEETGSVDLQFSEYTAEIQRKDALRVFACTDSFWDYLLPFMFPLSNQLYHAFFGNGSMFELNWFKPIIDKIHPDAVIIESTERFLDRFLSLNIEGE